MRRIAAEITRGDRAHLLDRDRREPAAGEDRQRARQARRARRPLPRARRSSASPPSPPAWSPGSGRRPSSGSSGWASATLAELRARDEGALQAFGPRTGGWLRRRPGFEDETPVAVEHETKSQSAETTFDADVADREELGGLDRLAAEELCRRLGSRDLRGADDRDQGPARRLDQRDPLPHRRGADQRPGAGRRAVALELLRAYSPPRPVRLLGVRVAAFGEGEPAPRSRARRADCSSALAG